MTRILQVPELLSAAECASLIARLESLGFHQQPTGDGDRIVRARCVFQDADLAARLWSRLAAGLPELGAFYGPELEPEPPVPSPLTAWRADGLNDLLRCYKYRPGERFGRHVDFSHKWDARRRTFLTVLCYLNDDFAGGKTWFAQCVVAPRNGGAAVFAHELEHRGLRVRQGIKYVLRSDVVFSLRESIDA